MKKFPTKFLFALAAISLVLLLSACSSETPEPAPPAEPEIVEENWFEDVAQAAGVGAEHVNRTFENPYAQIMQGYTALGASASVADVDGDGWEDVFYTRSNKDGKNLLYRNKGDFTFEEIGEAAGVADGNDENNASADSLFFDYDNDGDPDLFVVRFGQNLFYENQGVGEDGQVTFKEVTMEAGFGPRYLNSILAIAFDYDLDSDLDLFLGNYFQPVNLFNPETPRFFPESFETAANGGGITVYRNDFAQGKRSFTDVTEELGMHKVTGWTLDLGHADADHDGDDDLYVAADFGTDNFYRNNGDGTFTDLSIDAIGIDTKKGMNVDWGDFDGDGLFDVFVTNITDEYMKEGNFLWQNLGDLQFADVSRETGTYNTGWGWAGKFFDYDNNGLQDLYVVNGWVSQSEDPEDNYVRDIFEVIKDPTIDLADARNWPPMGNKTLSGYQPNSLFRNEGGLYRDVGPVHGLDSKLDARGVALADFDHDGRVDLFVTNAGRSPHLWRNVQPTESRWIGVDLTGAESNRDAVGARVWIQAGGRSQVSFVNGGNGFASQSTTRVHFGTASATSVEKLVIVWPTGVRQQFTDVPTGRYYELIEGGSELRPRGGEGDAIAESSRDEAVNAPEELIANFGAMQIEEGAAAGGTVDELTPAESGGEAFATYKEGMDAFAAGDEDSALDKLEEALRVEPDNLRYGTDYRQVAIKIGEKRPKVYERSVAFLEKLTKDNPQASNAWLNLAFANVDKIPVEGAITQVLLANTALEHFGVALGIEDSWLGRFSRGNAYLFWPPIFGRAEMGIADVSRAIELADESGETHPYHSRAWVALGDGYWRLDDIAKAREIWAETQEKFPGDPESAARLEREDRGELDKYLNVIYDTSQRVPSHLREIFYPEKFAFDAVGVQDDEVATDSASGIRFREVAEKAGVRFVHSTREFDTYRNQVLQMFTDGGAAVAVGDYDNDGDEDMLITDSDEGKPHLLMKNVGVGSDGNPKFENVAEAAGVTGGNDPRAIVADAMWLDYDNDGLLDLYLGRFGTPVMYRNLGEKDGEFRFEDVSERIGLTTFANTIGTIAFDGDADGRLDLMLANYFKPSNLLDLQGDKNVLPNNLDYADNGGGLTYYRGVVLPNGEAGFEDVTASAGIDHHTGWSLDIGHADLDNDGDQDVYVAGDYGTDRLFLNNGDGTFEDVTEANIGFDTRKGMNVDMGDYDRDGYLDIYVTNITDEYMKECNMLWNNMGDGTFLDLSKETGTCDTDWGWAAKFGDYDNDGWEDLFVVNGLRSRDPDKNYIPILLDETILKPDVDFSSLDSYPNIEDMTWSGYQKQRFFHNLADGTFKEIGAEAGVDNDLDGRGIGVGDFNNDGLLDFYQSNANQESLLYMGETANAGNWIQMKLKGTKSNRDGIGARVTLTVGGETMLREVNGGNGYSSSSTLRLHFGVGDATSIDKVEILWPSGTTEVVEGAAINQIYTIEEGKGIVK